MAPHHGKAGAGEDEVLKRKLAYAAQRDWLTLFGRDFYREFGSDPMTLLVRTSCGF